MTSSSLRPIRRAMISSFPAAVSNRQPLRVLHDRHGKRPLLVADHERLPIGRFVHQAPLLGDRDREHLAIPAGGCRIGRRDQRLAVGSEDGQQFVEVPGLDCRDQRLDGVMWRSERAMPSGLEPRPSPRAREAARTRSASGMATHDSVHDSQPLLRRRASSTPSAAAAAELPLLLLSTSAGRALRFAARIARERVRATAAALRRLRLLLPSL